MLTLAFEFLHRMDAANAMQFLRVSVYTAVLSMALMFAMMSVCRLVAPFVQDSFMKSQIYRPPSDSRFALFMLSPFFTMPCSAALYYMFVLHGLSPAEVAARSTFSVGADFAFALWLLSAVPGMLIDYLCFNMTKTIFVYLLIVTCINYVVTGGAMAVFFVRDPLSGLLW